MPQRSQVTFAPWWKLSVAESPSSHDNVNNSPQQSNQVSTTLLILQMPRLTDLQRLAIARRLRVSSEDAVVGVREAAVLYNTSVERIHQATAPTKVLAGKVTLKLPPSLPGLNGRQKVWRLGDLLEAIRAASAAAKAVGPATANSASEGRGASAPASRMGRPRAA